MNEDQLRLLAEEVTCPLCLEIFHKPRVLACQHTYCTECLHILVRSNMQQAREIGCPMCRRVTSLEVVEDLPINITLSNIISHLQTEDIQRIISPELTESRHACLHSFPPSGPGTDFSFLAFDRSERIVHTPHDINQLYLTAPTLIDYRRATMIFQEWIRSLWFKPSQLVEAAESFSSSVMIVRLVPFYRLTFQVYAPYQAQVTRQDRFSSKYTSASEVTYIRNVSRHYQASQEHVICASESALVCSLLDSVASVQSARMEELVWSCSPFAPDESLPWFVSWTTQDMNSRVRSRACDEIREQRKEASMCAITHLKPSIAHVDYTLFYHPFYISSYEYQGKTYRFAISAQTGEIVGERPYGLGRMNFTRMNRWLWGNSN